MRAPNFTYIPVTIAANSSWTLIVEDQAALLPLYDGVVLLRNIEPVTTLAVTLDSVLTVTGAGIGFDGDWENRLVDTTLAAEGMLSLKLPVSATNGTLFKHRIEVTNASGSAVTLHAVINGTTETTTPPAVSTYVVVP